MCHLIILRWREDLHAILKIGAWKLALTPPVPKLEMTHGRKFILFDISLKDSCFSVQRVSIMYLTCLPHNKREKLFANAHGVGQKHDITNTSSHGLLKKPTGYTHMLQSLCPTRTFMNKLAPFMFQGLSLPSCSGVWPVREYWVVVDSHSTPNISL